jgi:hypothetical protein
VSGGHADVKIGWVGAGSNTHALRPSGHPRKEFHALCGADHLGSLTQTPAPAHSPRSPDSDAPLIGQITCRGCARSIKAGRLAATPEHQGGEEG